ncbi:MAG TPA: hypothetical protein VFL80_02930 [Thermoanaerobaculia bacterium]|nr:hypothetical protein [Thermoanaerobaculia bacterium]
MKSIAVIAVAALVTLAACRKEAAESAAVSRDLDKRGTVDLLKQTADDHYDPPADGRLTESQVQMYLKVREHEKKIVAVAKAEMQQHAQAAEKSGEKSLSGMMEAFKTIGSAADVATADIRAAKDLGFNTQEYLWIKQQILAVSAAALAEQASKSMAAGVAASYEQMKKAHDEATDPATKKMYADMLAGLKESQAEAASTESDPTLAYNRQLLTKYESALNAFATELAKWESKPGEVQKAVSELQKAPETQAQTAPPQQ